MRQVREIRSCWHQKDIVENLLIRDETQSISCLSPYSIVMVESRAYIGEGNGTPLQYSCQENPMDGGAW